MDIVRNDFIDSKTFSAYVADIFRDKKIEDLTKEELVLLFMILLRDFYNYKLTMDHLSNYSSWIADHSKEHGDSVFDNALVAAFELTYYVRKVGESAGADRQLSGFLKTIKEYFEENKDKIKNWKE